MPLDDADIAALLDEDMPGYALASFDGEDVPGLFRGSYAEALGVAGINPEFRCATAAVAAADEGDAITIAGTAYTIAEIQDTGTGITMLALQET